MPHISNFRLHIDLVLGSFDNFMRLFNRKVANGFTLFIGNLNLSKYAIADCAKYPDLITALHKIIVTLPDKVTINRIQQKVIKDHERIKWHAAIFKHKNRYEHTVVKQMLGHCRI